MIVDDEGGGSQGCLGDESPGAGGSAGSPEERRSGQTGRRAGLEKCFPCAVAGADALSAAAAAAACVASSLLRSQTGLC